MTLFKCDDNQRYDEENSSCYFHESELKCLGCECERLACRVDELESEIHLAIPQNAFHRYKVAELTAENESLRGLVKSLTSLSLQLTDQLQKGSL